MNQMYQCRNIQKFFLSILAAAILTSAGFASAVGIPRQGDKLLLDTYHRHKASLESNCYGLPLVVESFERDDRVHVDVYGIFDNSFSSVVNALKVPANWCDIVFLHPNIKACIYRKLSNDWLLTFYPGKKVYQPPEDARQVMYHYRVADQQQGYLDIILNADAGPFGTKNHRMRLEALPLDRGRTFVHVSYAYSDSTALRLAAKIYFATLARSKVGFTVTGKDDSGNPVYIGGPRGALERSAVRYYLAIQSFMDTLHYPEDMRFNMRINTWYDRTTRYKRQLFDLDKNDYLTYKTAEHKNQVELQRLIVPNPH
ncbi:MAG: hypothetical protein PHR66_14075 [Desulfuromonadaceae bacterium]|nr:hypothetical protein [Desulfuromonadaceae bacterium]